ncbi:hypothetical protein JCM17823_13180 [Halorubrum gandharaense]
MNPLDEENEGELALEKNAASDAETDDASGPEIPVAPSVDTFGTDDEDFDQDFGNIGDVDGDTLQAFVRCVIYLNAAVLLVSLGTLFWYFEGRVRFGQGLLLLGGLAGARCYQTHREWRLEQDDDDDSEDGDAPQS